MHGKIVGSSMSTKYALICGRLHEIFAVEIFLLHTCGKKDEEISRVEKIILKYEKNTTETDMKNQ